MSAVLERFLRYVRYNTQADPLSSARPSSPGQLVLLHDLAAELRALGLRDVVLDDQAFVMATVPASPGAERAPVIGLLAHVDTSPELSGDGVRPIVHAGYDGRDLVLPDDPSAVLRLADHPALGEAMGHDIVTASGTTLLGADDKAGVAEIMTAVEALLTDRTRPHGAIRVAFTPDEEIGRGTDGFDVARFGARYAYTLDGGRLGVLEAENFSADQLTATFFGFNTHPGYARGQMVNAIKVAADCLSHLPADRLSPETAGEADGFVHPYMMNAGVDQTMIRVLLRDFETAALARHAALVERLAQESCARFPGSRVEVHVEASYRNMREVVERHPDVAGHAREAIRRAGLTVRDGRIRGGTDGARLSFMGVPTPNLFAGQHNIHSRLEWTSVQSMEKAVEVILRLVDVWTEAGAPDARPGVLS
jgi:tripeptide aminopeptidase